MATISELDELRRTYLRFFESKGHLVLPSASLKSDDPGLMFNVAGMQQFKPYFQGAVPTFEGHEGVWKRVVTSQKCMRAGGKDSDIENVGRTRRHHTFFEMLGNFSFGDYFKSQAAAWAWEFLTHDAWLGLDPERLYVTVFTDDDEAYDVWTTEVGVPAERVSRFGEAENFWPANAVADGRAGPCGPCSEIFYDRGPEYGSADETGPNTGAGDRYMEIWNLVFTQYDLVDGELRPLPMQNIDTGMGFERLATVVTGAHDAYGTELMQGSIRTLVEASGVAYRDLESPAHRIIADHARSVTMCIADGILPANDGAGYVIKMLIRRAARQAYLLGVEGSILHRLVANVADAMGGAYPAVRDAQERIAAIVRTEEEQFLTTLEAGIARVKDLLDALPGEVLDGETAFDLWQTYGFPLDLTVEMAAERGLGVDRVGYDVARERERARSRAGRATSAMFGAADVFTAVAAEHGPTVFVGFDERESDAKVLAIVVDGERLERAPQGSSPRIVLDRTPCFAEGGGQVGDAAKITWSGGLLAVTSTTKGAQGVVVHHGRVMRGALDVGADVRVSVDPGRRETKRHHTATHLLHAALREVLGEHVAQAGSLVAPDRLRFDFSHGAAIPPEALREVEQRVQSWILTDLAVTWEVVPIARAREAGAMMLFGEKYGEQVRMVRVGDDTNAPSIELCGGTHVRRTGEIGTVAITLEEAAAAGVRRIEAVAGRAAFEHLADVRAYASAASRAFGARPDELEARVRALQAEVKGAEREHARLRDRLAAAQTGGGGDTELREASGYRYAALALDGLDAAALRTAADTLLQRSGADVVVLGSGQLLVVKVSETARERGAHAGNLVRELAARGGGGGGGRPDMAQAGVKDAAGLEAALGAVGEVLAA
ncbi:alanine--tRNA ligase [soil metagenome]